MARLIGNQLIDNLEDLRNELENLLLIKAEMQNDKDDMLQKTDKKMG